MPSIDVVDLSNATVGSVELADAVFGAEVNEALLYEAVRQYTASQRPGTASTKTRHEVSGSGKKLWKQKGTGRARMGSIRSPLWRHGGTVHGPQPRSYDYKLPRKMLLGALRSALSAKLRDGEIKVVREFNLQNHKTKHFVNMLATARSKEDGAAGRDGRKSEARPRVRQLAGREAGGDARCECVRLLRYQQVLLTEAAAKKLSEALA